MLSKIINNISCPSYVFDLREFTNRVSDVKRELSDRVGLVFSIKANPFLTKYLPDTLDYIEVCSPGELTICEKSGVDLRKVIFSGVNKTDADVKRALDDCVGIFTAESKKHVETISRLAMSRGQQVPLILRLSCGNQFGMDKEELCSIIRHRNEYPGVCIIGLHMYTGTQKKKSLQISKELDELSELIERLKSQYDFETEHVEYGPGIAVDYFSPDAENNDTAMLAEVCGYINSFAARYPITVEMGRFLAATCGTYLTRVMDTKVIGDIHYCICDGGVHQMKYYGQTMAMQVPPMEVYEPVNQEEQDWSVCGSLCTTADVLVRKVRLTGVGEGSVLAFHKVGAYSVCEGISLFLSRELPAVYLVNHNGELQLLRDLCGIAEYNMEGRT